MRRLPLFVPLAALLGVLIFLLTSVAVVEAQGADCQIISTNKASSGSTDRWVDVCASDMVACEDKLSVETKACYEIEDACNKKCNVGRLATLSMMPCQECIDKAAPCYNAAQAAFKNCLIDHDQMGKTTSMVEFVPLDELIDWYGDDRYAKSLLDKTPSPDDLKVSEEGARLNEEIKSLFPDFDPSRIPAPKRPPEITGPTPYLFDDPLSTKDGRYFSFTADAKNHLIEFKGGNKITLEFPDGTTFSPENGDFVRVPVGTKIKAEVGLYQGGSEYNINKWGSTSLGITNVAGGSAITIGGGGSVELVPSESGSSNVKITNGDVRIGSGGFGWGNDRPDLPTEIQFEGRREVKVTWDGTDFAVSYDKENGKIVAEIYDGSIKVQSGEKGYTLASSYGGDIQRIEVGPDGIVAGKIALVNMEVVTLTSAPVTTRVVAPEGGGRKGWMLLAATLVGLALVGILTYWHHKKHGSWPLETKWKPILVRLKDWAKSVMVWVTGRGR